MAEYKLRYRPTGPVSAAFFKHRPKQDGIVPVDGIRGPIGSGKSISCMMRLFAHMAEQAPGPDGVRRSRWAIVRNTNPELEMTTIKSWLEWFPEEHFGEFRWAKPYCHRFSFPALRIEAEVWFIPIDDAAAVRKLLSLELTGAFVNEAREVPREVIMAIRSRCNRYPSRRDGGTGATWAGVIFDTNSPDEDHWISYFEGKAEPPDWMDEATRAQLYMPPGISIFVQPGGLIPQRKGNTITGWEPNPAAENLRNLPPGYYQGQIAGQSSRWLLTMCANEFGPMADVRLVYDDFNQQLHVSQEPLEFDPDGGPLLIGADFARNPAAIFAQEVGGQLRVLRECIGQNIDVAAFTANEVVPTMRGRFPQHVTYKGWGDPSGSNRTGADPSTAFSHSAAAGLTLLRGRTNDPDARQRAVTSRLTRMLRGQPAILISPACKTLIAGFKGGYKLDRVAQSGSGANERFKDEPVKNLFSHVHDALQYLCSNVDQPERRAEPTAGTSRPMPNGRADYDPFALSRMSRLRAGA